MDRYNSERKSAINYPEEPLLILAGLTPTALYPFDNVEYAPLNPNILAS